MAAVRVRGLKRPTDAVLENDNQENQSKTRCRSPSHLRESPGCQHQPNSSSSNNISTNNFSCKSTGSTTNKRNSAGTSSTTSSDNNMPTGTSSTASKGNSIGTNSTTSKDNITGTSSTGSKGNSTGTNGIISKGNSIGSNSIASKDNSVGTYGSTSKGNDDGHNNCSKWCKVKSPRDDIGDQYTNVFDVNIPLPVVEYCRAYLGSPGIRLFLEKTKDKDNWHPWDHGVKEGHEVDERQSAKLLTEVINADEISDEVRSFLTKVFLQNNSLDRTFEVMAYHPKYLSLFLNTQRFLMQADGPLPFQERHYIAILAAAQHQCSYLVDIHTKAYINFGGDPEWLKGLDYAPRRLWKLNEVNKLLAHQPWRITRNHIQPLFSGSGRDRFSMAEMMQAVVLLAHFQSLSSFICACGINTEQEPPQLPDSSPKTPHIDIKANDTKNETRYEQGSPVEFLVEKMSRLARESLTEDQMRERFEKIEVQNAELSSECIFAAKSTSSNSVLRFVDDPSFGYEDFSSCKRKCGVSTFRAQDFSWHHDSYQMANHLYLDIGIILDEKFTLAQKLTYYTMGDHADIDTSSFRLAIWNYVHSLFGIRHDEYDYSEVDQLLERNLKTYIKTTMCYPERVTRQDYDAFMVGFKHSEKVHVNLMTMEARFQAQLMYSLRAITKYMYNL